jgi:hypothetical protein
MMTLFQVFGTIDKTPGLTNYPDVDQGGLAALLSIILKLLVTIAAIWTLLQIIFAGFGFISAGGDPKAIESAWSKVWQSVVGLTVVAGAFVLAAIFGYLIFGDAGAILSPKIYTP